MKRARSAICGLISIVVIAGTMTWAPAGATAEQPPAGPPGSELLGELESFAAPHRGSDEPGPDEAAAGAAVAAIGDDGSEAGLAAQAYCLESYWTDPIDALWLDVAAYGLLYDCNSKVWATAITTYDLWTSSELDGFLVSIDTDGNVSGNGCALGDYQVFGGYLNGLYGDVVRTPSCDSSTWTYRGPAYISRNGTVDFLGIGFDHSQIGSPKTIRYSGAVFSIWTSGGDLFPNSGTHRVDVPGAKKPPAAPKPVVAPQTGGPRLAEGHSIFRLYAAYMLRQPDVSGLSYWQDQYLTCSQGLDTISDQFASSAEFNSRYGSLSNREFVELVYNNVLGRAGEPSGVAYWTSQLDSGAATRGSVMTGFSESSEYIGRTKTVSPHPALCVPRYASDSVYRLYKAYFLREPDTGGERHWSYQYGTCQVSLATVSDSFAGSAEFASRYGSLSNRAFVELVYANVLGRPGEPSGVAYWTSQLDSGAATRGGVMVGFSESPEFVSRTGTLPPVPVCG